MNTMTVNTNRMNHVETRQTMVNDSGSCAFRMWFSRSNQWSSNTLVPFGTGHGCWTIISCLWTCQNDDALNLISNVNGNTKFQEVNNCNIWAELMSDLNTSILTCQRWRIRLRSCYGRSCIFANNLLLIKIKHLTLIRALVDWSIRHSGIHVISI